MSTILDNLTNSLKSEEVSNNISQDTGYVYDNIRPTILVEPDKNTFIKKEEIKEAFSELVNAQISKNPIQSIEHVNNPDTITLQPEAVKDEYGLTDEQSKLLLDFIFCVEGGYFNHPNDPGGETMYGIIKTEARNWGYNGPMKDLPREVACNIYKKKYWKGTGLENIENFGVAMTIFDFQVNSGIRGVKIAQKTANKLYECRTAEESFKEAMKGTYPIAVDGKLGPKSFDVINKIPPFEFLMAYNIFQEDQYEDLMRNNPKLRSFDEGWENRMIKKTIHIGALLRKGVIDLKIKKKK